MGVVFEVRFTDTPIRSKSNIFPNLITMEEWLADHPEVIKEKGVLFLPCESLEHLLSWVDKLDERIILFPQSKVMEIYNDYRE